MQSHQRIARRVLAEHKAIAGRLQVDPLAVLDFAHGNITRWKQEFEPGSLPTWLTQWEQLLSGPQEDLVAAITADTEGATQLRMSSPFVGLLTYPERIEILRDTDPEMALAIEVFEASWDQRFPPLAKMARSGRIT